MLNKPIVCTMMIAGLLVGPGKGTHAMDDKGLLLTRMTAVDGRTLESESGNIYRLHAIAVPTPTSDCADASRAPYDCAEQARVALQSHLDSMIRCTRIEDATGSRPADIRCQDYVGRDIGGTLVKKGWAVPDRQSGLGMVYAFEAMEAQAYRRGLWQGRFDLAVR